MAQFKRDFSKHKPKSNFRGERRPRKEYPDNTPYFKEKYDSLFGVGTFDKLLLSKSKLEKNQFLRVNTSRISVEKIEEFMKKEGIKYEKTFLPNFFKIVSSPFSLAAAPEHLMGWYYIQDLASGVPINSINWRETWEKSATKKGASSEDSKLCVLDLCASPGSKTTQICDTLESLEIPYSLYSIEPQQKRLTRLINNIQKMKLKNVEVFQGYGESISTRDLGLPRGEEGNFDVILVDAPCSGNLISDRNWLSKRNKEGIYENSSLQKRILENAKGLLKEDGVMIYSTCSMEVEENEENVHYCVKELGMRVIDTSLDVPFSVKPLIKGKGGNFDSSLSKCVRFMPYESDTEGFFVAVLVKLS